MGLSVSVSTLIYTYTKTGGVGYSGHIMLGVTPIGQLLSHGNPSLAPIRYREQGFPSSWIWPQYQQWSCTEFIKKRFNHFQVREQEDNQNSHPWGFHSRP